MTEYEVVKISETGNGHVSEHKIPVEADTVAFKEGGVVAFYDTPDEITLNTEDSETLVTAFKEWSEVRGTASR